MFTFAASGSQSRTGQWLIVAEIPVERARPTRVRPRDRSTPSDRVFAGLTRGAGIVVLVILTLIAVFLVDQAGPALSASGWSFFTTVDFKTNLRPPVLGVLGLLIGTVTVALIAVAVAIPTSVLTALFITDVATGRIRAMMMGLSTCWRPCPACSMGCGASPSCPPCCRPCRSGSPTTSASSRSCGSTKARPSSPPTPSPVSSSP